MTDLTALDDWIIRYLNQYAQVNPAFDRFVFDVVDSDLLKGGIFMAYFWWLWFRSDDDVVARREYILMSLAGALSSVAVSRLLQRLLPFHDRPLHAADLAFVPPAGVNPESLSSWSSFPSDHAALFFGLSAAIWTQSRLLGLLAGGWSLLIICVPRVYLGYHYPSDVAAGAVLGVAIVAGVIHWGKAAAWPGRLLRWSAAHQPAFYCAAFIATYEITILFYDVRAMAHDGLQLLMLVPQAIRYALAT